MLKSAVFLFAFFLCGWFLFSYKLTDVPPGINGDEAVIGYLASHIANTAHDQNGKFLPLFTNFSWPDWKQPVTIYTTAATFKLFGISYFNLRAVSIFFALLSGTIIYFLTKELLGQKPAILSLLIFSTIPIIMIQTHLAIENIAPLPFIAFWLLMIVKYFKRKRIKFIVFAAIALGISLFSYLGLRLIAPTLAILSIGFVYYINHEKKNFLKPVLIFIFIFLFFVGLMLIARSVYPGAIFASTRPQEVSSYQQFILPYISSFDLSFLFLKGDSTSYHSTGNHGMFLLATLPLFLLGVFKIAKERKPIFIFILTSFFIAPILYAFPGSVYRASRLLVLIPSFIIICILGISYLSEIKNKFFKWSVLVIAMLAALFNYLDFLGDFWFDYPKRVAQSFEKPLHRVFEEAASISKKDSLKALIQEDLFNRNPPAYLFFERSYFPGGIGRWNKDQNLPSKSLVIMSYAIYNSLEKPLHSYTIDKSEMDPIILIGKDETQ